MSPPSNDDAMLSAFKTFLTFRSTSFEGPHNGAYQACADFLAELCRETGLEVEVLELVTGKPVVWATWQGRDPERPSILLNSHYDVVPADEAKWTRPAWTAHEEDGRIYGRGTQDMKSVCIQYVFAVRRMREAGFVPARTVHLSFVPDEEIGGADGIGRLLLSDTFQRARVGCALDEGLASPADSCTVFYGERAVWWLRVRAEGPTGHASRFIADPAPQRLLRVVQRFLAFRDGQERRLGGPHAGCKHATALKLGDVATLNLTMLKAGVTSDGGETFALNVIPTVAEAGFDIRIPPTMPLAEFEAQVDEWTMDEGVSWEFVTKTPKHGVSSTDEGDEWWDAIRKGAAAGGVELVPEIFPAATDSRYLRQLGIPAYGFSPMPRTPILLHEHDEYIPRETFVRGVSLYVSVLSAVFSVA